MKSPQPPVPPTLQIVRAATPSAFAKFLFIVVIASIAFYKITWLPLGGKFVQLVGFQPDMPGYELLCYAGMLFLVLVVLALIPLQGAISKWKKEASTGAELKRTCEEEVIPISDETKGTDVPQQVSTREEVIRFRCPSCNKKLSAPRRKQGSRGTCTKCSTPIQVP